MNRLSHSELQILSDFLGAQVNVCKALKDEAWEKTEAEDVDAGDLRYFIHKGKALRHLLDLIDEELASR